ncbi:uncharacterized protein LOC125189913 [Salvia hispanica]|uniref:uncharacterized protein LOC125189913 n=1 Tax=Salvia hispanica TaxID=49212 RepID=UPI0020093BC0|nr:uncharacterized protein LOC125189913 [Salvia hispanica]
MAKKKATSNPTSTTGDNPLEVRATAESRSPSPQQSQPTPTPQIPAMVPLDALAAYLRQQDPNKDLTATLAGFSLTGGMPAIPSPTPTATTVNPTITTPNTSNPTSEKTSTAANTQSEPSNPSAYQDPNWGETEERESEGKESEGEKDEAEEITATETRAKEAEREEIDLNEMARKQGLMTDDEFQSVLGGGDRIVVNPERVAEVLDLTSQAVGRGETAMGADESEGVIHQSVEEMREGQTEEAKKIEEERQEPEIHQSMEVKETEEETETQPEETSIVSKPKPVKRRLVLKNDPKAERQNPQRVSQRCLGKWKSNKAGANTAANAVEASSEDEKTTPTKPGEEPSKTSQKDTQMARRTVSSTPKEDADKVVEGLDLASESVGREEAIGSDTSTRRVTEPTTHEDASTQAGEEAKAMEIEDKYIQERKRKGKAPAKKK